MDADEPKRAKPPQGAARLTGGLPTGGDDRTIREHDGRGNSLVNRRTVDRVACYIDGFSFYHGLKSKGWKHYYWLDFRALMTRRLGPADELVGVAYFTSHVRKPRDSRERQLHYLDALDAHGGLEIVLGEYEHRPHKCPNCEHKWDKPKEKMTDVALATRLVMDALDDVFDTAFLVCADADLVPAVRLVRQRFAKKVVVIPPPGRRSDELINASDGVLHLERRWLAQCQLPDPVVGPHRSYDRPVEWK